MAHELPKAYDPTLIEDKWSQYWLSESLFRVDTPAAGSQQPIFTILLPPPNVTGRLHMGHMLNQTEMDILVRWHRMLGDISLWLPGTDHAGIATQMMVERRLKDEGKDRRQMGREKFVERVWEWRQEYGGAILDQMKRLGASVDWSREYFTMDEGLSQAVREAFVRLFEEGLIYRGAYIVNWCPRCMTAISDLEVVHEDIKGSLWDIRYPVLNAAGEPSGEYITVSTTRPETMLGDVAVAVNPNDERYTALLARGAKLRLPLVGRELPLIADDYANPEFGTGAVKVTPAHDPNDYQIGLRHNLPQINIFDDEARVIADGPYNGLDRYEARKRVLADLESQGLLAGSKEHTLAIGKCDRCKSIVEPRLSTQWFVATTKESNTGLPSMKQMCLDAVRQGHIKIVPEQYKTVYLNWIEGLHDWCISRQLWWGHRLPAWHCSQCNKITVARETPQECQYCGSAELMQDPDVLDTWFSSALLPFSGFGWPDKEREQSWGLDAFYPTSLLVTGFDILFFWVARMVMMGTHFMSQEPLPASRSHQAAASNNASGTPAQKRPLAEAVPFREVYIHALVRDADRQKMSKTKGNVIDPIEITQRYGTDAVRFTLASQASPGTDIAFNEQRTEGYRAFANKIWNASRFLFMNVDRAEATGKFKLADFAAKMDSAELKQAWQLLEVRWILSRFERATEAVNRELKEFRFDEAARVLYQFFWGEICDWYLELIKLRFNFDDEAQQSLAIECLCVSLQVMEGALRMLAPFMPFITEEIWHALYDGRTPQKSLALAHYPGLDVRWIDEAAEDDMQFLQELIVLIRDMRADAKLTPKQHVAIRFAGRAEQEQLLSGNRDYLQKLAGISEIQLGTAASQFSRSTPKFDVSLIYELQVDASAERARIEKEIAQLEKELEGKQKQLSNDAFLSKAPSKVVEGLRSRVAEIEALLKKYRGGLGASAD
ncbi:MAG TPA: valine--tRNA ligase [Terriglobales bacterium]